MTGGNCFCFNNNSCTITYTVNANGSGFNGWWFQGSINDGLGHFCTISVFMTCNTDLSLGIGMACGVSAGTVPGNQIVLANGVYTCSPFHAFFNGVTASNCCTTPGNTQITVN